MGLTKQYLRYVQDAVFGLVASQKSNVVFMELKGMRGRHCAVGVCEDVIIWDVRTGEKYMTLKGDKHEVTKIARSPDRRHMAVGYNDGMVRIFDISSGEATINFSGHKSTVTALQYDVKGLHLVSGAKDTDVIVWDIVSESGLYRLKGHKGMITQARFLSKNNVLVTSSKDTFVKFWDLDTQHCFHTLVGHRTEVHDFVITRDGHRIVTGSGDSELRVWDINYITEQAGQQDDDEPQNKRRRLQVPDNDASDGEEESEDSDDLTILRCSKVGSIMRQGRDRVVSMTTDESDQVLLCHGNDALVEVYKLPSEQELSKRQSKRQKKLNKKSKADGEEGEVKTAELTLEDEIQKVTCIKMTSKVASVDVVLEESSQAKMVAVLNNNSLQTCSCNIEVKKCTAENVKNLTILGHRTDVRTVSFSSDNTAILSASGETAKIWNRSTLQCIRTMPCSYALCSTFAPGDRHIIIGTKNGKLLIFDIASGSLLESIDAHSKEVWSLSMTPDKRGIVSGSADQQVKFWNFELVSDTDNSSTSKRLTLEHSRTLRMDEDILAVQCSPDNRLIAVSLLDNTVKVFFTDTLKFFLSLYGHKLPVLCMDISTDSTLLVTGSADRNTKIWGLDFGDCHKSIFAHDDSIMCIKFIPRTHLFFTGGKDGTIKQWDADNFESIVTLKGHHAEIWCMTTSPSGNFLVTGSHDKSLRLWEKTREPLVLEDEREMEREKEYEESVGQTGEPVVPGETNTEVAMAGRKTVETVKGAERLMEALELYKEETEKLQQHLAECKRAGKQLPMPPLHPMLMAFSVDTPLKYMLEVLKKIRSSELEESLLVLPFNYVIDLIQVMDMFLERGWHVELTCRVLFFLLRVHHGQVTSSPVLMPIIDRLRSSTQTKVNQIRDRIGFNMSGLQFLQQHVDKSGEVMLFKDATLKHKNRKKKQKVTLAIKT
ncbi:WD repeat-containing protein 3-like [Ylistrum balloti]|uniref:WD repeat-containing protein 3-like n=1 Tax=Ylistrum balloti TaxID=509963 RepID=UPI0029059AAC|nr:WD repeat-containing protein 3-like [Ylistrum balloti]